MGNSDLLKIANFTCLKMAECGFHTLSVTRKEKVLLSPCILRGMEMDIKVQCNYSLFLACAVFPQTIQYFGSSWQICFTKGVNPYPANVENILSS